MKEQIKSAIIYPEIKTFEENGTEAEEEFYEQNFNLELLKGNKNNREYIISLFSSSFYAELFFAWCKDCREDITVENAKFFRDELLLRNNKDFRNFNFRSMRVGKNFIMSFVGNLYSGSLNKLNFADNLINDMCMHSIKSIISMKNLVYLNLASNMISTEGLKIFQKEVMDSQSLKYLNVNFY
jgi:hypothetical protein